MTDPEPTKSEAGLEERLIACGENCDHSSIRCIDLHREAVVALNSLRAEVEQLRLGADIDGRTLAIQAARIRELEAALARNREGT